MLKNQKSETETASPTTAVGINTIEPTASSIAGLPAEALPEEQVDFYIENGQAAFIYFHSNNCLSCIDMM